MRFALIASLICTSTFANAAPPIPQSKTDIGIELLLKGKDISDIASFLYGVDPKLLNWAQARQTIPRNQFRQNLAFYKTVSDWPDARQIQMNLEAIWPYNYPSSLTIGFFDTYRPKTVDGMIRYLEALKDTDQEDRAKEILNNWWPGIKISTSAQKDMLRRYRRYFTQDAHEKRFFTLLRIDYFTQAKELSKLLGRDYQALQRAVQALSDQSGGVDRAVANVPTKFKNHPSLVYERVRWRRIKGFTDGAADLLLGKQLDLANDPHRSDWWRERHIVIRRYIEDRNYRKAYALAKTHQQINGASLADASFVAGWLALSYLNRPEEATQHFKRIIENTTTPISQSRGLFWSGLAHKAAKNKAQAQEYFQRASAYPTTFYGQEARQELNISKVKKSDLESKGSHSQNNLNLRQRLTQHELVKFTILLHKLGQTDWAERFARSAGKLPQSYDEHLTLIEIYNDTGLPQAAVAHSRRAGFDGYWFGKAAFPIMKPEMRRVLSGDPALAHAITRQESNFNQNAVSRANAYGLMQLLAPTARDTARKINTYYSKSGLLNDPVMNVRLGSAYLTQMIKYYDGNVMSGVASYNAGPGNVNKWLKSLGPIPKDRRKLYNWIESIPFPETRNYVQRVIEARRVYESIL